MHPITHLNDAHNTISQAAPASSTVSTGLNDRTIKMRLHDQHADIHSVSSGTTTPTSMRSSLSNMSSVSSQSSTSVPNRSSMKSSLKSRQSTISIKSSPPTVRFADPELPSRPKATPLQHRNRQDYPQHSMVPNPLTRNRHRPASMASNSASSRYSASPHDLTLPPHGVITPHQINFSKSRANNRFSAPVQPLRPNFRQSQARVAENFTPPSLALERRVSSFQSVSSNLSIQCAPVALQLPPSTSPPGQYNPLEQYIPCLDATCTAHYSERQLGLAFYLPQGPYSLSKHHGYCPKHAAKELKDANAWCKRNYESLRQNAGRKTLGQIASEFDTYLEEFRQERKAEDEELQQRQKHIVLGSSSPSQTNSKAPIDTSWDWRYTPRHCTRAGCSHSPYSPFSNHLFSFYHTQSPNPASFSPLPTLCPPCAKNELEAFERMMTEKWNSRCGWHEVEWEEWINRIVTERFEERVFWETAQERDVRDRGFGKVVEGKKEKEVEKVVVVEKKKKSVLRRLFGKVGSE